MFKKRVLALFVILQVVVTSMFPAPAFAATYAPEVVPFWGVTGLHVVQGVSNRFDAALGLIGEWGKKIQISNANYVALSNEGSGGAFYTLANAFSSADPNPIYSPEGVTGNPVAKVAWTGQIAYVWANYGSPADWLWYCNVDDELISAARTDFLKVLNGESLGSSGGGGAPNAYTLLLSDNGNIVTRFYGVYFSFGGTTYVGNDVSTSAGNAQQIVESRNAPDSVTVLFSDNTKSFLDNLFSQGYELYMYVPNGTSSGSDIPLRGYLVSTTPTQSSVRQTTSTNPNGYYDATTFSFPSGTYYYFSTTRNISAAGVIDLSNENNPFSRSSGAFSLMWPAGTANGYSNFGSSGGGGGGGDNHWPEPTTPEPDPQPTNPEPDPEPPDPPTYDPPTYTPPGFSPDVPVTIVPPDNTTAADYTPWLRAILTALNTIIDDLGEHCDHIRVAMRDYLSGFYDALSDDLQAYYDDLTDYMSDLAKWIVSHLNFDVKQPDVNVNVPGYDDSSVVGWLRRIYYKLGGSGSPKPDPIEDTDGALDWWAKFLQWITNALGGLLTDFVGDLGGFLQELIDTFPFSIPWDIVAMLTLLDAQRATPDFTVTIPAHEGWWDDITVRIELSAYNDAMATVRGMVMIWWMYILVMKTDWMMLLFDGANNAISDFVSRLTGKG